ncbi:hypothetical protein D3C80_1653980 [compost metagenome]
MLVLLITLLSMNTLALLDILLLQFGVKRLCSLHANLGNIRLDLAGTKLAVATSMLVLNSLFLIVGGVALLTG